MSGSCVCRLCFCNRNSHLRIVCSATASSWQRANNLQPASKHVSHPSHSDQSRNEAAPHMYYKHLAPTFPNISHSAKSDQPPAQPLGRGTTTARSKQPTVRTWFAVRARATHKPTHSTRRDAQGNLSREGARFWNLPSFRTHLPTRDKAPQRRENARVNGLRKRTTEQAVGKTEADRG